MAEVLITLGIIGVVAALTMPSLIANHQKQVVETRLKKFYSVMNQALSAAVNDFGEYSFWYEDYAQEPEKDADGNPINKTENVNRSFKKYFSPYLKIVKSKDVTTDDGLRTVYYFADGSAFSYWANNARDIEFFPQNPEKCLKTSDVDERSGSCSFWFLFYPKIVNDNPASWWTYHTNKGIEPFKHAWDGDINKLYHRVNYGCYETGRYCSAIIQYYNWKIPKDYPRKIKL